jgi:hypothetical protein
MCKDRLEKSVSGYHRKEPVLEKKFPVGLDCCIIWSSDRFPQDYQWHALEWMLSQRMLPLNSVIGVVWRKDELELKLEYL